MTEEIPAARSYGCLANPHFQAEYQRFARNRNIICDECRKYISDVESGDRWKCKDCSDYDLCEGCWNNNKQDKHFNGTHIFAKI